MLIARRIVAPTPGRPNMVSVSILPPIIATKDSVICVTTIINALRNAWPIMTLALDAPLERAVFMYS